MHQSERRRVPKRRHVPTPLRARQDDGYLIGFVLVGGESFLKVVDAASMRQVALAPAPAANPTGLHACWVPGANFEDS